MSEPTADLRSYYEEEARLRLRKDLTGRRVDVRNEYIALLAKESRRSVLDFGAGPGGDVAGFCDAGFRCVGLDLAHGNGVLAAERGLSVVQASIAAPPIRPRSFDAGWSMSTLMHLRESDLAPVLAAMTAALAPGAPLFVGLWGGRLGDQVDDQAISGERRLFSLRTSERNHELLGTVGHIEQADVWPVGPEGWEYHLFLIRTHT